MPSSRQKQIASLKEQIERKQARLDDLEAAEAEAVRKKRTHVLIEIGGTVISVAKAAKPGTDWDNFDLTSFDAWLRKQWIKGTPENAFMKAKVKESSVPPTAKQIRALEERGLDPTLVKSKEEAQRILTQKQ